VAALTEVDNDGMAMMVNNARAAMSFFTTHLLLLSSLRIVSKPDWLLPMRLPSSKIYSRSWFENSLPSITAE
jgi:hypothetical protein